MKRMRGPLTGLMTAMALAGCEVTNPGPVADEFLDLTEAHQALVNGSAANLSAAVGDIALTGGLAAREVFPTGQQLTTATRAGRLISADVSGQWTRAQQARWIAEDAIQRFTALGAGKVAAPVFTQAYVWAGYANRLLGENMCDAVFDGGPKEPYVKYLERAQAAFGSAITMGTGDARTAAYAGRASVRASLKDWAGAVSDAQQVPLAFVYRVAADIADPVTRNEISYFNGNNPYRIFSGIETWFLPYFQDTGDPRVPFAFDARYPTGVQNLPGYGQVAWWTTPKYSANNTPFRLASGREMVLIRAEALLNSGDWQGAMTLINSLRTTTVSTKTGRPLDPWAATNITQAWTFLKRERSIELWLEGRRLGDMRRWKAAGTPGVLDWPDFEAKSSFFRENPPSECFPIPDSEINSNPNF
jgi:hypothetical protein